MNPHDRRIAPGLDRVGPDLAVILLPDPPPRRDRGRGHQLQQIRPDIGRLGDIGQRRGLGRRHPRPLVQRRLVGQRPQRDIGDHRAVPLEHHMPRIGHFADHREIELPLAEDAFRKPLASGLEHHQHPLLALRQHHLIGGHPLLAARHRVHVEPDADPALRRHLDARRGQASRPHVLDRDDRVRRHQLEARLDQQFLGERIADLDRRPLLLRIFGEVRARHGRAMNPVAPGLRSDIDDRIADPRRRRVENLVLLGDPHGHRVDQDIAVVRRVEIDLAADRRHADAIAVSADPRDHPREQMPRLGMIGPPEPQRVQVRHRPRAHREHVAQNPAHPCRRSLIGLDVGRMVMALHLEDRRQFLAIGAKPDVDHPGILARPADHPWRGRRQLLQMHPRRFVTAMLGPHHREDAELDHVRLAPHGVQQALIFVRGKAVLGDDLGSDGHGPAL